jgi:hypothetical protein
MNHIRRRIGLACLLLPCLLLPLRAFDEVSKPEKLTIHTWVREDMFAGLIGRDAAAFDLGLRKLERFLGEHPGEANGLAWKFETYSYYLRADREAGNQDAYTRHWTEAQEFKGQALANRVAADVGPLILVAFSQIFNAQYAATAADRESLFREGRELLRKIQEAQSPQWDKLPVHMRGELWSLIGFASDQIGDREERLRVATEMIDRLKGSVYEARGRRWLNAKQLDASDAVCLSCHENGRLKVKLASLNHAEK